MTISIVLGAGMVGVSTALALQENGHHVVLLDRKAPGRETSFGNAGIIQTEAVEPYAFPRSVIDIARVALKRGNDVDWRLRDMPRLAEPLWRYFAQSAPAPYARTIAAYSQLALRASDDHARFIEPAGAGDLIARQGWRAVYRSPVTFDAAAIAADRLKTVYGVPSDVLGTDELAASEPALQRRLAGAVHWTSPWTCRDPGELVARYAALFVARGGTLVRGDAMTLRQDGAAWRVSSEDGVVCAENAVVALGPWSPTLAKTFGYRIPMVFKRGYHRHFAGHDGPRVPMLDVDNATLVAPMNAGWRVLTGAHMAPPGTAPASRQIRHAANAARELFGLREPVETAPWSGTRPCMPDMLPVVGPTRHKGLWFHFGHGHQGFTLGPTTAFLLAEQIEGRHGNPLALSLTPSARGWA
ncbi:FAD-dependent oxidoreductase (plasmid) [Ensifer adhaerens]|uniref:NAD(P)/FAD-dependent oxidoreductase n=1 Tax=Ensifer adhaerens TaxID=106592 RepID=UPI0023A921FA|nr:FAD-dependent oxidoreductase [Ensifer adhaerens]WDZ81097.1 FAD-dependent oxidoreductase [Ensifer adhaerens]